MTATQLILAITAAWLAIATLGGLLLGAVIHHADQAEARQ